MTDNYLIEYSQFYYNKLDEIEKDIEQIKMQQ